MMSNLQLPKDNLYRKLVSHLKKSHLLNTLFKKVNVSRHIEIHHLEAVLKKSSYSNLLDIGCGDGYWTKRFSRYSYKTFGIDPFESDLKIAKRYKSIEFKRATAENIPYKDESFDVVLSVCVFEHLYEDQLAFHEIYRVLNNKGILLATVDSLSSPGITESERSWHKERCYCNQLYTIDSLTSKLRDAGFQLVEAKYIISSKFSNRWELLSEHLGFVSFLIYPFVYFPIWFIERKRNSNYGYKLFVKASKIR